MSHPAGTEHSCPARRARAFACLLIGPSLLLASCATPSPDAGSAASSDAAQEQQEPRKAEPKRRKAPAAPPKRLVMTPEMDEKLAAPLLLLLERDAQIQQLDKKLDEAVQETVRSKAKLTSQESRAEAASNLAEAEVALKTLKGTVKGLEKRQDYARVAGLMKSSAEELRKENYGGSLFLTNQIKAQLRDLQDRIEGEQQDKSASTPAGASSTASAFDVKLARLQTLLSEKDAQIRKLQRKLDDTIQEAVRTKSKLRSQENRAEAASSLAEAETAMKTLKGSLPDWDRQPEAAQAGAFLALGADEFKKENYSGSLYVTNQVKGILKDIQENSRGRETIAPVEGEVLFALPLTLRIAASGKAHEQPAADAAVAWSVERGASPTAVSYKGPWIRVKDAGGRWGWIFYNLIASP